MNWHFISRARYASVTVSVAVHGLLAVMLAGFMLVGGTMQAVVEVEVTRPESVVLHQKWPKLATSATVERSFFSATAAVHSLDNPLHGLRRIAVPQSDSFWTTRSGEIAQLTGRGSGVSGDGTRSASANFFGVPAYGKRFVYVVDCSLSMRGERWQKARAELVRSLQALEPDARFMIVFFSDECQPMPAGAMQLATEENIALASEWVRSVRLGWGTKPLASVQLAHLQNPDAIFLLTDGEFADRTAAFLREQNVSRGPAMVHVHTIAFHSREGVKLLKRIARENSGQFRYVSVDDGVPELPDN